MIKHYRTIERTIDFLALFIVVNSFLHFIGARSLGVEFSQGLDNIFIGILAIDFIYRYRHAENRSSFFKESWIELLSLIPGITLFRAFRIFRIIKKSRLLEFFHFVHSLLKSNGLYYVIAVVFFLSILGGGILFKVEESIATFSDGIWFSLVTMTTVGYGDFAPTTDTGRFISVFLMIIGVGFLSILSGSIASFLMKQRKHSRAKNKKTIDISDLSLEERKEILSYLDYLRNKKN